MATKKAVKKKVAKKKDAKGKTTPKLSLNPSKDQTPDPKDKPVKGEQTKFPFLKETKETKAILRKAIAYKAAVKVRQSALAEELVLKDELLTLVHESKIKPGPDNIIRFDIDGTKISATPRDELIKVKLGENEISE